MSIDNASKLISVIVPVYKTEKYIREALDSLKAQTYSNFEALLIDDGSPDASPAIIDAYAAEDDRFIAVHQPNGGVSSARNHGLDLAKGEYIAFLDSDDVFPADALERLEERMTAENADLVVAAVAEFDNFKTILPKGARRLSKKRVIEKTDKNFVYTMALYNKLYRRDIIERNRIRFNYLRYLEDGDFLWRYLACPEVAKIYGVDSIVYRLRFRSFVEEPSITQKGTRDMFGEVEKSFAAIRATIEGMELPGEDGETKKSALLQSMSFRYATINMIDFFYRIIWKSEVDFTKEINEKLDGVRELLTEVNANDLIAFNPDIDFNKPLPNKEELARSPIFSIIIAEGVRRASINNMLASLYAQKLPAFTIHVPNSFESEVEDVYNGRANLSFYNTEDKNALRTIARTTEFLIYADSECYWDESAFRKAFTSLRKHPGWTILACTDMGRPSVMSNKVLRTSKLTDTSLFFTSPKLWTLIAYCRERHHAKSALTYTGTLVELLGAKLGEKA